MQGRIWPLLFLAALLAGCDAAVPSEPSVEQPPPLAKQFAPDYCGTITGSVHWSGEQPHIPPFLAPLSPLAGPGGNAKHVRANPNLPIVDAKTGGVNDAVVYLRQVDAAKSRPWDYPPVRVEFRGGEMVVLQGDYVGRRGFVHRGASFAVVSRQALFETLQVRGAAFFSLTLPDRDLIRSRRLDQLGVVELTSGVGRFWMRGHLFVVDHPYYVRTNASGRFVLPAVPAGRYQLVCWHPNWHEDVREHDADTCCISRMTFQPSAEVVQEIEVRAGHPVEAAFELALKNFPR